jgi:hypothetical protein
MADIPASFDLVAAILNAGYPLRKVGAEHHGACPFCGGVDRPGDPSDRFYVNMHEGRQWFHCRQCDIHGDGIAWYRSAPGGGMTYAEALRAMGAPDTPRSTSSRSPTTSSTSSWQPIEPPPPTWRAAAEDFVQRCAAALWSPTGATALRYLREHRRLSDDAIRKARIGWHDPGAGSAVLDEIGSAARGITIPRWYAGALWAVNIRRPKIDTGGDKKKRYRSLTGSRVKALFNGDVLITPSRRRVVHTAIVCGGEFDVLCLQQHAPPGVAVVTLGGEQTRPDPEALAALQGIDVYLALDADEGGENGAAVWSAAMTGAGLSEPIRCYPPLGAKDITDAAVAGADLAAWLADITGDDGMLIVRELVRMASLDDGNALFGYTPQWDRGHITMTV